PTTRRSTPPATAPSRRTPRSSTRPSRAPRVPRPRTSPSSADHSLLSLSPHPPRDGGSVLSPSCLCGPLEPRIQATKEMVPRARRDHAGQVTDAQWQAFTGEATRLEAEQGFSGILRTTRGEDVLLESCHGLANRADGIPVTARTRFATASLSKMFTAIGVLDAAGRGEVSLDSAVVDVLPEDKRPSTIRDDVTVHHLLSHTSGIADYFEEDEDLPGYREDYGALWDELPTYRVRDYVTLLPLFADLAPVCPPGTAYHYSNAGYVLLGILLAEVAGMPFTEAVETRVFEPAGMTASGYLALDEVHRDVAQGYLAPLVAGGPWRTNVFSVPAVGGGDG